MSMCRMLPSRIHSASDHYPKIATGSLFDALWRHGIILPRCLHSYLNGMGEVRALQNSGRSERRSPTRKERANVGYLRSPPHTCCLSLHEIARTARLPHASVCTIADPCTTIPACQITKRAIGAAPCRGILSGQRSSSCRTWPLALSKPMQPAVSRNCNTKQECCTVTRVWSRVRVAHACLHYFAA